MVIEFINQNINPDGCFVTINNQVEYTAIYDKATDAKLLYDLDKKLIARGFPFGTKKIQFIEDYMIQLMDENPIEILIKNKSLLFQTKIFAFQGADYTVVPHIGTRYSIFKGEKQIASYQTYDFFSGRYPTLICDDDVCKSLFSLLSLYLYSDFSSESAIPNTPVKFCFQAKKNNKNWQPNSYL